MQAEELIVLAEGDTPVPLLIVEEPGLGYAEVAARAAGQWAEQPVQDFSSERLMMSKGADGLEVRELLHGLSLKAGSRRAVLISLAGSSVEVQNALLKTLEEPPEKTWIIALADPGGIILPTVKSRCSVVHGSPWSHEELAAWAQAQDLEVGDREVDLCDGNPGRLRWISENREAVDGALAGQVSAVLSALNAQEKPGPWLSQLLSVMMASDPRGEVAEARRLALSGVRPELVLASAFLL